MSLSSILAALRRHLWFVIGVTLGIWAVVSYFAFTAPPTYRAGAVVRLTNVRIALAGGLGDPSTEQLAHGGANPLLSQIHVLRSRAVTEEAIDSFGLRLHARSPGFSLASIEAVAVAPDAPADTIQLHFLDVGVEATASSERLFARYGVPLEIAGVHFTVPEQPRVDRGTLVVLSREAMVRRITGGIVARQRSGSDVIDVEYTDSDPRSAQRVVNAVVQSFRNVNTRAARQQSQRRRAFIEDQLVSTDSLMSEAQRALSAFRSRAQVFSSRDRFAAQQAGMINLEVRREEMAADRRILQTLLSGLQQTGPRSGTSEFRTLLASPSIAGNPVIAQLYGQLVGHETEHEALITGTWANSPSHPDVQRLQVLIGSTEGKLIDAVRSHIVSLDARIAALDDLRSRNVAAIQDLSEMEAEEVRLVRQVETIRGLGDQLRADYQKVRISEAVEVGPVEILDHAARPQSPVGSGPTRKALMGLFLGLMLGGGGAILRDVLNTSISRRADIEVALQIPGLAVIPQFARRSPQQRLLSARRALALPEHGSEGENTAIAETSQPPAEMQAPWEGIEAYRTLRTNLIFSQAIQSLQVLILTSPSPAEGKSTTAANLALSFAQQGIRVLLVDADLRRPSLHKIFNTPREPGLTNLVAGQRPLERVIRQVGVGGLHVLPAGTHPPNPSELLGGPRMRECFESFREQFDMVIVDTPPLLTMSDAAILSTLADGVLLVLRAGSTDRGAAAQALQQLATVGARVVGAVLNDPDSKARKYSREYSYDAYRYYADVTA